MKVEEVAKDIGSLDAIHTEILVTLREHGLPFDVNSQQRPLNLEELTLDGDFHDLKVVLAAVRGGIRSMMRDCRALSDERLVGLMKAHGVTFVGRSLTTGGFAGVGAQPAVGLVKSVLAATKLCTVVE